jgi:iron complex outermembrane recepter protein
MSTGKTPDLLRGDQAMKCHMLRTFMSTACLSCAVVSAMGSAQAFAQDGGKADTPASESETDGIAEIVVTAQYRSESLQKVPLAISSVAGDDLAAAGVSDLTGLSASVPGLYLSSYSTLSPQLFVRGIGSNDDGITSEGAVGVYLDGAYVGRASSALFDLFDLERVEVLRGPQGTLYGRNTNGGAIKIETTKPSADFHAGLEAGYGNYDQKTLRGLVSGPLTDNVFAKVSGSFKKRDGWTRDMATGAKLNDEDSISLRGQLRILPSDTLEAVLSVDYARDRPTSSFKEVVGGTLFGLYQESPDRFVGSYDVPGAFIRRNIVGGSATINWDIGAATISSVSGYRKTDIHYTEDYDSTPFPVVTLNTEQHARQFTQELRIVSKEGDSSFSWIGGVFYLRDRGRATDQFLLPFFGLDDEITNASTRTSSIAAFGELSYRVTPSLKITAGARYTHERKQLSVERLARPQSGAPAFPFVPRTDSRISFDNFSPRLVVEYQATDDVLGYASVTRGFKSGGFNNFPADAVAAATPFAPEKITSYEAGLKAMALDRHLRVNASAFLYDYTDLQVFAPIDTGAALPVIQITNAAKARVKGLELEVMARPTKSLTFNLNYAHLLARYRDFPFGTVDLSGNRLSRSPRDTLNISAEWSGSLTAGTELRLRGEYVYSSNLFFTPFNDPDLQTGNVGLFNASATIASNDGRWTLSGYGRNLGNKHYLAHGIDGLSNFFDLKTGQLAAPRQYGVTIGWRY